MAIIGVGADIIEIDRVKRAAESPGFRRKVFTPAEQAIIERKGADAAAGFFALKEAASKALGTGFANGLRPTDLEITYDGRGRPRVSVSGEEWRGVTLHGSITHSGGLAAAFAVAEKRTEG